MFSISVTKCHVSSNDALFARFLFKAQAKPGPKDALNAGMLIDGWCWTLSLGENRMTVENRQSTHTHTQKKMDSSPVKGISPNPGMTHGVSSEWTVQMWMWTSPEANYIYIIAHAVLCTEGAQWFVLCVCNKSHMENYIHSVTNEKK